MPWSKYNGHLVWESDQYRKEMAREKERYREMCELLIELKNGNDGSSRALISLEKSSPVCELPKEIHDRSSRH